MHWLVPVLTFRNSVSTFLGKLNFSYQLPCGDILVGVEVRRVYLYHKYVAPLSCGGDRSSLFSVSSVEEDLEPVPCIEVGGFLSPL